MLMCSVIATAAFYRGRHSDTGWLGTKYLACTLVLRAKLLCQFSETADALKRGFSFFSVLLSMWIFVAVRFLVP